MDPEQHAGEWVGSAKKQCTLSPNASLRPKRLRRATADAARQVDEERMVGVHPDAHFVELLFHLLARHRIAEEQGAGVLVIDEEAGGIAFGLLASLLHRHPVIVGIFHHDGAMFAQLFASSTPAHRRTCGR